RTRMKWTTLAGLLLAAPALARAESGAEWTYSVTYRGKPVSGAKVGLVPVSYPTAGEPHIDEVLFATTDSTGEARFRKPAGTPERNRARLLARDATNRGGYGLLLGEDVRHPPTMDLYDNTELTARVTDADGKPVSGLILKPVALGPESFARFGGRLV